jgi:hypothetical protein
MRTLVIFCLTLFGIGGQPALPPGSPAGPVLAWWGGPTQTNEAQSNQQKARAILDKMIATMGGQNYLTVQDFYAEGRYGRFYHDNSSGTFVFFRYWQWPDKDRWEISKQRDVIQLYLGDTAYEITFRGAHEMDPKKDESVRWALIRHQYALPNILRTWLNAPGTALFYEGQSLAENKMAERITIINAQNDAVTLLVDTITHLPVMKTYTIRDPQSRDRDSESEIYDNWRMVQGINTPYNTALKHNGDLVRQEFVSSITYNSRPPENIFSPKTFTHK